MAEKLLNFGGGQTKRKKLTKFAIWPVKSDITKPMLIEKDVWDLVFTRPCYLPNKPRIWAKKAKEDCITVVIAQQII